MKALVNDIKARIKDPISNNELSNLLFQLGHENDIQDNIIDIDITPNRGDCLSLLGILRDLKNFYQEMYQLTLLIQFLALMHQRINY